MIESRWLFAAVVLFSFGVARADTVDDQTKSVPDQAKSAHSPRGHSAAPEWELRFPDGMSIEEYARQLDFFKIEIGAVSRSGKIEYISKVGKSKPEKRVGNKATDYRWRIGWKNGNLHQADRKLLAKAGINSQSKELLHFFPINVQTEMSTIERAYAKEHPHDIRRTRFEIRPRGTGYELVVVEQEGIAGLTTKPSTEAANKPALND